MKKALLALVILALLAGGFYFVTHPARSQKAASTAPVATTKSTVENIPALIIPHINVASTQRQAILKEVSGRTAPAHIIIASVNHQSLGEANVLIYPGNWQVQTGELKLDKALYDNIVSSGLAKSDANSFLDEHGIKNVIADIHSAFPDALYTSVIIKDTTTQDEVNKLADFFTQSQSDTLFVGSVDFSHYNPRNLAYVHDDYAINALSSSDPTAIWQAETDSPQVLTLAAKVSKAANASNFHLTAQGNSADELNNDDAETTSFVLGYYSTESNTATKSKTTNFTLAGDAMFDREIWHTFKNQGLRKIFDNFGTRVFRGSDIAQLNNEGPISATAIDDDWSARSMVFNFPPSTIDVLKYLGVKSVSLANNHSLNAGASGFATTRKLLTDAGITNYGKQVGFNPSTDIYRVESGVPTSIFAVDALDSFDEVAFETTIKAERDSGRFVIIYPHWGTEYQTSHDSNQKRLATAWIAAGAGMIIGSHPHVVEDFEIINGVPVVYSLGNFVFDQYFSKETQHGLIVSGIISEKTIRLTFLPTKQVSFKPQILQGAEKQSDLERIFDINHENGFKKVSSDTIEIAR